MPCRCTATTLKFFIRNVAHLDLSLPVGYSASRSEKSSTRSLAPRAYHGRFALFSRGYSSEALSHSDDAALMKRSRQIDAVAELSLDSIDSILAEANSQIPPTREESKRHGKIRHDYKTPVKSLPPDLPETALRQKDATRSTRDGVLARAVKKDALGSKKIEKLSGERLALGQKTPLVRRAGGTANTSFTLHYSAQPSQKFFEPVESHGITAKKPGKTTGTAQETESTINNTPSDDWEDRREPWMKAKERIKEKYPEGYKPMKKLSPDAIAGIRALNAQMPDHYTVPRLSREFEVSPESIIRILRTKWKPSAEEEADRQRRWHRRGQLVWSRWAAMGKKPPKQWRLLGIGNGKPEWLLRRQSKYVPPPLPALITTARRKGKEQQSPDEAEADLDLADKIL